MDIKFHLFPLMDYLFSMSIRFRQAASLFDLISFDILVSCSMQGEKQIFLEFALTEKSTLVQNLGNKLPSRNYLGVVYP